MRLNRFKGLNGFYRIHSRDRYGVALRNQSMNARISVWLPRPLYQCAGY